jgi:hypothetical protein
MFVKTEKERKKEAEGAGNRVEKTGPSLLTKSRTINIFKLQGY